MVPAFQVLRVATQLVEAVQTGLAERGFGDVRPQHGFAFLRLATGDATLVDLAQHLGVSKQAAGQLVDQLIERGYLVRRPHPRDGRARLLVLTDRGRACTGAAEQAARDVVAAWRAQLGDEVFATLLAALAALAEPGPVRPSW